MAGYSDTPLIKKLGIKTGDKIIFINEPASIYKYLGKLPEIVTQPKPGDKFDYIHFFTTDKEDLAKFFDFVNSNLDKNGTVWISWPKKTAKIKGSLNENIIRELGLKKGLVDVKVAAIDNTWSGLKFVYRLKDR